MAMTPKQSMALAEELGKLLELSGGADFIRATLESALNMIMQMEAEQKTGASRYERTPFRITSLNGTRSRQLDTAAGRVQLAIPKLREGVYYPSFLDPRRQVDKALVTVIQEAYINGVSTRKVERLVESMGIDIDKSKVSRLCEELSEEVREFRSRPLGEMPYVYLDATFPKVREGGRVQSMALAVAIGVARDGSRHVLGFEAGVAETGELWTRLLTSLVERGLRGVRLAVSDAHKGIRAAVRAVLCGSAWQRCKVHFLRNVLDQVPNAQKGLVGASVRTIFAAQSASEAKAQLRAVVAQLEKRYPKAMAVVLEAEDEVLAYMEFPKEHWTQICSSNVLERLNREIKRRMEVVSVFPGRDAVERLIGHVLIDWHIEWASSERRYLSAAGMAKIDSGQALLPAVG
jgi:transposase-like protein